MEFRYRLLALDGKQFLYLFLNAIPRFLKGIMLHANFWQFRRSDVISQGVRNDKIAISQALHQGTGAESVGTVIGEIRLTQNEQAGDCAHQIVIHPKTAHGVMNRRIDPHWHLVGILIGDALVHFEQVTVFIADGVLAETLNRIGEV